MDRREGGKAGHCQTTSLVTSYLLGKPLVMHY